MIEKAILQKVRDLIVKNRARTAINLLEENMEFGLYFNLRLELFLLSTRLHRLESKQEQGLIRTMLIVFFVLCALILLLLNAYRKQPL